MRLEWRSGNGGVFPLVITGKVGRGQRRVVPWLVYQRGAERFSVRITSSDDGMMGLDRDELFDLFPATKYRHRMHVQVGTIRSFFGPTEHEAAILAQRRHWLVDDDPTYVGAIEEASLYLAETLRILSSLGLIDRDQALGETASPIEKVAELGRRLEPDFMVLAPQKSGPFRLVAGCICFPSSWSLSEKVGLPLDEIHQVVPDLNSQLGRSIDVFLERLKPESAWLRSNWGLSRSSEFNQHPVRRLRRLDVTVELDEVWLRVEQQALVRLPETGGVLFGIRIANHALRELAADPDVKERFRISLETMPEAMAVYKNIASCRKRLLELL